MIPDSNFPEELLLRITLFCTTNSLAALCLVSKKLNRIATATLYSDLDVANHESPRQGCITMLPLAYLVFTSPAHAHYVKSITMLGLQHAALVSEPHVLKPNEQGSHVWPMYRTAPLETALKKRYAELTINEVQSNPLLTILFHGSNQITLSVMIIASLPNLRRLNINTPTHWSCSIAFHEMLKNVATLSRHSFENLPERPSPRAIFSTPIDVIVDGYDPPLPNGVDYGSRMLNGFFQLPNLRSIIIYNIRQAMIPRILDLSTEDTDDDDCIDQRDDVILKLPSRSCPAESIHLVASFIYICHLQSILDTFIPGKLESLSCVPLLIRGEIPIHPQDIIECLKPHHKTLESLELSHEIVRRQTELYHKESEMSDDLEFITLSYKCFTSLKYLKISPVFIWGRSRFYNHENECFDHSQYTKSDRLWKMIPKTVESLCIGNADGAIEDPHDHSNTRVKRNLISALDILVKNKPKALPQLNAFQIQIRTKRWSVRGIEQLASVCNRMEAEDICCRVFFEDKVLMLQNTDTKCGRWFQPKRFKHLFCTIVAKNKSIGQLLVESFRLTTIRDGIVW